MTLLFMDGFQHHQEEDNMYKWDDWSHPTYVRIENGFGRWGGRGVNFGYDSNDTDSVLTKTVGDRTTLIAGFAFYVVDGSLPTNTTTGFFLRFMDGDSYQVNVRYNNDRTLSVFRGTTLLGTTTNTIDNYKWYYIEVKVTINSTTGSAAIHVDGSEWLNLTNQNTQATGNATVSKVRIGASYSDISHYYDDFYICDDNGTVNNDFLGDVHIETIYPTGDGNYSQFTPVSGDNYANVDDPYDIDDTTYVEADTVGYKDSYTFGDMSGIGVVKGIAINTSAAKTDAGTKEIKDFVRINSTDYPVGSTKNLQPSYRLQQSVVEINPDDSNAWQKADIDAIEAGIEIIT